MPVAVGAVRDAGAVRRGPGQSDASWRGFLDEALGSLARAGSDTPEIDARRIAEEASGAGSDGFHSLLEGPMAPRAAARARALVARRCAGEPLQYVLGRWGFRSLDLLVDERVLIPRPETEAVAGWAVSAARERADALPGRRVRDARSSSAGGRGAGEVAVVDLGTGSGAIALSVAAECRRARVFATDVSEQALEVARANLAALDDAAAARVALCHGDWFDALPAGLAGSVDVIVSNPPYVGAGVRLPPVVEDWEPSVALRAGPGGGEHVAGIISEAPAWLRPDGALVIEIAPQLAEASLRQAREAGFAARVERDLAGRERVLVGVGCR